MAKWMAYRYFCNVSDCLKLMLPPGKTTKNTSNRVNDKMQNFVYLAKDVEEIKQNIEEGKIKSEKQLRALNFLIENENSEIPSTDLQKFCRCYKCSFKDSRKKWIHRNYTKRNRKKSFFTQSNK